MKKIKCIWVLTFLCAGLLISGTGVFSASLPVDEILPEVEGVIPPQAKNYDFLETFDSPTINLKDWDLEGRIWSEKGPMEMVDPAKTIYGIVEAKIIAGKLYLAAKGRNNASVLKTKKRFENVEFILEYDLYPITEVGYCGMAMVGFPASPAVGDFWRILSSHTVDGKINSVQIFANYQAELSRFMGSSPSLTPGRWYHFRIQNRPAEFLIEIIDVKEKRTVYENRFKHDEIQGDSPIEFAASSGETPDIKTLNARFYLDNICWKVGTEK